MVDAQFLEALLLEGGHVHLHACERIGIGGSSYNQAPAKWIACAAVDGMHQVDQAGHAAWCLDNERQMQSILFDALERCLDANALLRERLPGHGIRRKHAVVFGVGADIAQDGVLDVLEAYWPAGHREEGATHLAIHFLGEPPQ
ncbi:hypothetical protein D9M70_396540 [compost metagenome]